VAPISPSGRREDRLYPFKLAKLRRKSCFFSFVFENSLGMGRDFCFMALSFQTQLVLSLGQGSLANFELLVMGPKKVAIRLRCNLPAAAMRAFPARSHCSATLTIGRADCRRGRLLVRVKLARGSTKASGRV
jgi:hypothetical protein